MLRGEVLSVLYDNFSVFILFIYLSILTFYWVSVYFVISFQFPALNSCNSKATGKRWIGRDAKRNDHDLYKSVNPTTGKENQESWTPRRSLNSRPLKDEIRELTMITTPLAFQLPCYLYPCEFWLHLQYAYARYSDVLGPRSRVICSEQSLLRPGTDSVVWRMGLYSIALSSHISGTKVRNQN